MAGLRHQQQRVLFAVSGQGAWARDRPNDHLNQGFPRFFLQQDMFGLLEMVEWIYHVFIFTDMSQIFLGCSTADLEWR